MRQFVAKLVRWTQPLYVTLAIVWALVVTWQVVEHGRVRQSARAALINRSRDITATLGLVVRSQRRFGGIVSQERMESALAALLQASELVSVALLNAAGETVVSAGPPIDFGPKGVMQDNEHWGRRMVTVVNLVDLGANLTERGETNRPTIVLPRRPPAGEGPDPDRDRDRERPPPRAAELGPATQLFPPEAGPGGTNRPGRWPGSRPGGSERFSPEDTGGGPPPGAPPRFGRPPFRMDEKEYKELLQRRGLHGLVLGMATDQVDRTCTHDLWLRGLIGCFATVSVIGLGLAWRNLVTSSELQMRLLRASELNTHLKEMNLAAAGLAHETRNPLNIIRGLAQMVGKQQDATPEIRTRTREIIDETDRVTAQLNEFINYSRPREVRRSAVSLGALVGEVARTLAHDLEENSIGLQIQPGLPVILADEQLLRQALFNLLLNAVQAIGRDGSIEVTSTTGGTAEGLLLEMRDSGPGVAAEHRTEIFKPYFTTHQKGTGLGLAIVQQIVQAHGWEIECRPNHPKGAIFRLSHLEPA